MPAFLAIHKASHSKGREWVGFERAGKRGFRRGGQRMSLEWDQAVLQHSSNPFSHRYHLRTERMS